MLKSSVMSDMWSASALDMSLFDRGSREFDEPASASLEIVRKRLSILSALAFDTSACDAVLIDSMRTSSTPASRRANVEASFWPSLRSATRVAYGRFRQTRGRNTSIGAVCGSPSRKIVGNADCLTP